jgi:hypothetical protein
MRFIFFRLFFIEKTFIKIKYFLTFFIEKTFIEKHYKKNTNLNNFKNKWKEYIFKQKYYLNKKEYKKNIKIPQYWFFSYKQLLSIKPKSIKYRKRFLYLIRQLKYRKKKKNIFKNWSNLTHWYTPAYLEVDYQTLRSIFIYYPESHEVVYAFPCSFNKIIAFYKERSL